MKSVQKLILVIVGLIFIVACGSNQPKNDIELDNGNKWEVNAEMKPHIEEGAEIVGQFMSQKSVDYQTLAQDLKAQNSQLIKSCTMKGKSHDELHKWLHPHMELIEELSNAKNHDDSEAIVKKLESSFKTYHTYFK